MVAKQGTGVHGDLERTYRCKFGVLGRRLFRPATPRWIVDTYCKRQRKSPDTVLFEKILKNVLNLIPNIESDIKENHPQTAKRDPVG